MLLPVLQMANGQQFLQIRPFLAVQVLATASLSLSIFWTYFPAIVAAMFATLVTFQQFVHITQLWPDFTLLTISNNFGRILNFHPDFTMYNSLFWHSSINFDHISEYYLKKNGKVKRYNRYGRGPPTASKSGWQLLVEGRFGNSCNVCEVNETISNKK